jgi:hypothetical protein
LLLGEFQSKARLYKSAYDLPPLEDKLSWLALMQHYGVPTRLLDFTYSPYLALYFALRSRTDKEKESKFVKVWAIDGEAVMQEAQRISRAADSKEPKVDNGSSRVSHRVGLAQSSLGTDRDALQFDDVYQKKVVSKALAPTGIRVEHFNQNGFVAMALPSIQNLRLSNQQGVFLFNGAEGLTFEG